MPPQKLRKLCSILILAACTGLALSSVSCKKKSPPVAIPASTPTATPQVIATPSFANDIYAAIIEPSCTNAACHDAAEPAGSLDLSTVALAYANLTIVALPTDATCTSMLRVDKAGSDPTNSLLVELLESSCGASSRMPKGQAPLHPNHIETIRNWIVAGATSL